MSLSILIKSFQYLADNDIKQTAKDLNYDEVSFYRCFIKNDKGFKHDIPCIVRSETWKARGISQCTRREWAMW